MTDTKPLQPEVNPEVKSPDTSNHPYLKFWNWLPASDKAFEKASKANGNLMYKISVFFSTFRNEMEGVEKEKAEESEKVLAVTKKTVEETKTMLNDVITVEPGEGQDQISEVKNYLAESYKSLPAKEQAYALVGAKKCLDAAGNGEKKKVRFNEARSMAAAGVLTLKRLREKYKTKEELAPVLKEIYAASPRIKVEVAGRKYPIAALFNPNLTAIFNPKPANLLDAAGVAFGVTYLNDAKAFLEAANLKTEAFEPLNYIKEPDFGGKKEEVLTALQTYIFPRTPRTPNLDRVATILNEFTREKDKIQPTPDNIAELATNISLDDFDHLYRFLLGQMQWPKQESA